MFGIAGGLNQEPELKVQSLTNTLSVAEIEERRLLAVHKKGTHPNRPA